MNIKNVVGYHVEEINFGQFETVDDIVDHRPKMPLGELSMGTAGFAPVFPGVSSAPVISVGDFEFFRLAVEERKPDGSVVRNLMNEALEKAKQEGRELSKKDKRELKHQIIYDVTRKTLPKSRSTLAAFEKQKGGNGRLLVFASSFKKAEELIAVVRDVLMSVGGSISLAPCISAAVDIPATLTRWVADPSKLVGGLELGFAANFEGAGKEKTAITNTELPCQQSESAIRSGQRCVKLEVATSQIYAKIDAKGIVSGFKGKEDLEVLINEETSVEGFDELNIYSATLLIEANAVIEIYDILEGALK